MYKLLKRRGSYFDDFFDNFFQTPTKTDPLLKTDIIDNKDNYELVVDVPGFDKEDIKIKLEDGYLSISAHQEKSEDTSDDYYLRKERIRSSAVRKFYVGESLNEKDIKAKLDKGVLRVVVPKEEEKPKVEKLIEIK